MRLVDLLCENVTYTCIICLQSEMDGSGELGGWPGLREVQWTHSSEEASQTEQVWDQGSGMVSTPSKTVITGLGCEQLSLSLSLSLSLFLPPKFFHSLRATPSIVRVHVCTSGLSNLNSANLPNLILAKVNSMIILMLVHVQMYIQCQQKVEIWDVKAERHPLLLSIKAHTRPVRWVCTCAWWVYCALSLA